MYHIFSSFPPPGSPFNRDPFLTPYIPSITHPSLRRPSAKVGHIVEIVHLVVEPVHIIIIVLEILRLIRLDQMREEVGVEVHGEVKRHVVPRRLHRVIGVRVAVGGLELSGGPRGGGVHGGSLAEVGEEAELVGCVLRRAVFFRFRGSGWLEAGGGLRFLVGLPLLPLVLEPHLDFLQYL